MKNITAMTAVDLITPEQAAEWRSIEDSYTQWRNTPEVNALPLPTALTNEQRGKLEQYEFYTNPPAKYCVYINVDTIPRATTWTGAFLGRITVRNKWRSNFGDRRFSFTLQAINGKEYWGIAYSDSGDYARIYIKKEKSGKA